MEEGVERKLEDGEMYIMFLEYYIFIEFIFIVDVFFCIRLCLEEF